MTARNSPMPKHGTTARYGRQCRCERCTNAVRVASGRRHLLLASGRWQPFTDPGPARNHIQALMETGMTRSNIASAANIHPGTLDHIRRGHYDTVRTSAAAAILAIPVERAVPVRFLVDATGTRRRIHALYRRGFSTRAMCAELGMEPAHLRLLSRGKRLVTRDTRARVAALFKKWHAQDPAAFGVSAAEQHRARTFAQRSGFAPAGAWNDIDDPAEVPDLGASTPRSLAVAEDVEFLRVTSGASDEQIAVRLGVPKNTLQITLARVRRRERVAA